LLVKIGFDLDMTLVDSSDAILKSAQATLFEFGSINKISETEIRSTVGLPMKDSLTKWLGSEVSSTAFQYYKDYYIREGQNFSFAMPGAVSLLEKLVEKNIEYCIISAKDTLVAETQLAFLNFPESKIFGNRFRAQKTSAMKEFGCHVYVGDHIEDYEASRHAGVDFIGVDFNRSHDLRGLMPSGTPIISTLEEVLQHALKYN